MKKIKYVLAGLLLSTSFYSCDDYLDVNDNPNNIPAEEIRPDQSLPGAMVMTYRVQGYTMNILGNRMMQNWYGDINNVTGFDTSPEYTLLLDNSFYTSIWEGIYLGVANYQAIIDYDSENYDNHKAIALIMKSYYLQYIVDLYGDAPYSEAFQGSDNITPAYDDDALIYRELVSNIDQALDLIDNADANEEVVGSEDVMYQGAMSSWRNFAKLLKIKLLLRQSSLTDSDTVTYLADQFASITNDGVPTAVATTINPGYNGGTAAQINPGYSIFYTNTGDPAALGSQATASGYIADFLNGNINGVVDPRRAALYTLVNGEVSGAYQGESTGYDNVEFSGVESLFPAASSDGIVMSESEAWFLLAEAFDNGYLTGDAHSAFVSGVQASFNYLGVSSVAYLVNIDPVPGLGWNGGNHLEAIMTQKWLAVNGINPIESLIDLTRTGYPNLPLATTAVYPNRPYRLMYPLSEYSANSANVPNITQAQLFTQGPFWKN